MENSGLMIGELANIIEAEAEVAGMAHEAKSVGIGALISAILARAGALWPWNDALLLVVPNRFGSNASESGELSDHQSTVFHVVP